MIELLVVIAIIAVLASLLLPVIAKAKTEAYSTQCLSRLRQWGLGLNLYATDNDDAIPRDGTDNSGQYAVNTGNKFGPGSPNDPSAWFNVLPRLMADKPLSNYWNAMSGSPSASLPFPGGEGKVWHCPAAKSASGDSFMKGGSYGFFSYVMNSDLKLKSSAVNGVQGNSFPYPMMPRLGSIRNPSATVLLTDAAFSPTLERYTVAPARNGTFPAARNDSFAQRHGNDGGNIVFLDGHAAYFKRSYVAGGFSGIEEKFLPDVIWNPNRDIRTP